MADLAGARIAFAGTPDFAVPTLRALLAAGADVPFVLTQPDRPAGRGRKLTPSPVKTLARDRGIAVEQPLRLDDRSLRERLAPAPDALVVVAYGLLLPDWLLAWPAAGCVNVHASLLPRWRGAAPIQRALLAGDAVTGVSLMRMARGLDTGPVYATASTPIGPEDTSLSLHDRLSELGAALAVATLPAILRGELEAVAQNDAAATYAAKLSKDEARIDWRATAAEIDRRVRAFNPWPVAESRLSDGRRLRIWASVVVDAGSPAAAPGAIVATGREGIDVATGAGTLRLTVVQADGGRAMPAAAWLTSQEPGGLAFRAA